MDGAKCFNDLIGLFKVAKKDDILSAFLMIENDKELENVEMTKYVSIIKKKKRKTIFERILILLL